MSSDLVSRLRQHAEWGEAGPKANDGKLLCEAAALLESQAKVLREAEASYLRAVESRTAWRARAEKAESALAELTPVKDMLVLCGELGGMGKDESPADYLRRLIDEVAGKEQNEGEK